MSDHATRVAVIGGGLMGRGISAALARSGFPVAVVEPDATAAALIAHEAVPGRTVADLEQAVGTADVVIEAVTENPRVKAELWTRLGQLARAETILASNTSSLRIDDLAALVPYPERVVGMHWFTPAELIGCIEVVRGSATADHTVDRISDIARTAGKSPVPVADAPGFVANRLQFALLAEAIRCVQDGVATAAQVDEIVRTSFGPRLAVLGPFANADLGGLDVYASIFAQLREGLGERYPVEGPLQEAVTAGRLGVKSGAGFADYTEETVAALREYRDALLADVIALTSSRTHQLEVTPWAANAPDR